MQEIQDVWPFHDLQSGNEIQKDRFYGFGDSGSLAGNEEGYETADEARLDIIDEGFTSIKADDDLGTEASQIGDKSITICTGEQFVEEMKRRTNHAPRDDDQEGLSSIGHFSNECNDDCPLWIDPGADDGGTDENPRSDDEG